MSKKDEISYSELYPKNPFKKKGSALHVAHDAYMRWRVTGDMADLKFAYDKACSVENLNFKAARDLYSEVCEAYYQHSEFYNGDVKGIQKGFKPGSALDKAQDAYSEWEASADLGHLESAFKLVMSVKKINFQEAKALRQQICSAYSHALLGLERAQKQEKQHLLRLETCRKICDYYGNFNNSMYVLRYQQKTCETVVDLVEEGKHHIERELLESTVELANSVFKSKPTSANLKYLFTLESALYVGRSVADNIELKKAHLARAFDLDKEEKWDIIGCIYANLANLYIQEGYHDKAVENFDNAMRSFKRAGQTDELERVERVRADFIREQAAKWNALNSELGSHKNLASRTPSPEQVIGSPISGTTSPKSPPTGAAWEKAPADSGSLFGNGFDFLGDFRNGLYQEKGEHVKKL